MLIAKERLNSVVERRQQRVHSFLTAGDIESDQLAEERRRQAVWDALTPEQRSEIAGMTNEQRTAAGFEGIGRKRQKTRERGDDAVLARFQRRYVIKDVVFGAAEEEAQARAEALNSRDRNLVEWTFKAYQNLPEGVKDLVTQVGLGVGAVGVSAGAAGLVAVGGIGAIAMAPILAAAAVGIRWRAQALGKKKMADMAEKAGRPSDEVKRLRAAQAALQKKASFTTFSGIAGWLTGKVTKGLQKEARTKAGSDITRRDELGNLGATNVGDLRSGDQFEALARSLDRAYATIKQADSQLATATTVGAVAGGMALGGAYGAGVHGLASTFHHEVPGTSPVAGPEHSPAGYPASPVASGEHHPAAPGDTAPGVHPGAPATPGDHAPAAPVAPPEAVPGAHPTAPDGLLDQAVIIDRPGEGFGQLIVDLKHNLSSVENPSPALKHFLDTNVNKLNHDLLVAKDGTSLTVQPGDKAFFDNNQNMWFQPKGGEPVLVFENDPTAPDGFITHEVNGHMQVDGVVHHEAPAAYSAPSSTTEAPATSVTVEQGGIVSTDGTVSPSANSGTTVQSGESIPSSNGVDITQGSSIAPEGSVAVATPTPEVASAPAPAPETVPAAQVPVASPEVAPAAHPPVAAAEAVPAPVQAHPAAPEQAPAPVATPEVVNTAPHPFASPDAPPLLNENGVDLNKPQVLLNEGKWFAHGTNVDDSYERAVAQSTALARAGQPNSVYFVVPDTDVTGREILTVRMVFTPPDGSAPQIAPFGEGLSTGPEFAMPPVPNDADYKLPPSR